MRIAAHQIQYMPGPRFFNKMKNCDIFVLLDDVQFVKREFQNRNRIRTAAGWQYITVPVLVKGRRFQKISDVEINNDLNWREEHLRAIKINYANAAHFGEYRERIEEIYSGNYGRLTQAAMESVYFLRKGLGIETPLRFSSEFSLKTSSSARIADLCEALGADEYLSGEGGRNYLDEELFRAGGVRLVYQEYEYPEYEQQFPGFEKNLSALDMLLNCGNRAAGLV